MRIRFDNYNRWRTLHRTVAFAPWGRGLVLSRGCPCGILPKHLKYWLRDFNQLFTRRWVVAEDQASNDSGGTIGDKPGETRMPPAEFSGFVVSLAQTALMQLGEMPDPVSGQSVRNLAQAKYSIDLIDLLVEKTRGNLTEEESRLIVQVQKDLKLKFVRSR